MPSSDQSRSGASFAEVLLEESPDTLVAVRLDGRVLTWNRGAEMMFGYAAAEAIGRRLDDLTVPAEKLAESQEAFQRTVSSGFALFETIRQRKDGAHIDVDVSMRRVDRPGFESFVAVSKKDVSPFRRLRAAAAHVWLHG